MNSWYRVPPVDLVADLRRFMRFLASIYGILAGISTLFPLSNYLFRAIPLPSGMELLYTTIAMIMSVFSIFFLFVARDIVIQREPFLLSGICFSAWAFLTFVYLYSYRRYDVVLEDSLYYGGSFMFLTSAFTIAAIIEYVRQTRLEPLQKKVASPRNPALSKIVYHTVDGRPHLIIDPDLINAKDAILLLLYSVHPEPLLTSEIVYLIRFWRTVTSSYAARIVTDLRKQAFLLRSPESEHYLTAAGVSYIEDELLPKLAKVATNKGTS